MTKDKILIIRLTSDEDETLRAMAHKKKITISKLVRDRVFGEFITVPVVGTVAQSIQVHNEKLHAEFMSKNQ
jgi:hypothetical protein